MQNEKVIVTEEIQLDNQLLERISTVCESMQIDKNDFYYKALELFTLSNEYKYHLK